MEAINHDLHALAKHLFGCMHKPFIHLCTYGVDRLAYALRYTTAKCFDCGLLTVRQHTHNNRLCLKTPCDDCHKITVPFFQRYLVETNHVSSGHVFSMAVSLNITINDTHDRFITDIFFDTGILNSTIDQPEQYLFFISFGKGTPWSIPRECLGGGRVAMTMEALIAFRAQTNKSFPAQNGQMSYAKSLGVVSRPFG